MRLQIPSVNQELLPLQATASGGGVGERAMPAAPGAALLLRRGRRPLPPLPGRQLHAQQERLRLGGILPPVLRRRGALGGGRDGGGELRVRLEDIQTSEAVSRPRRPPPVPSAETPSPPRLYIRSDTFTQALNIKTEQSH